MKGPLPVVFLALRALLALGALGSIAAGCYLLHPSLAYIVPGALVWAELRTARSGGRPEA